MGSERELWEAMQEGSEAVTRLLYRQKRDTAFEELTECRICHKNKAVAGKNGCCDDCFDMTSN
jgi:hypothetical protein